MSENFTVTLTGQELDALLTGLGTYSDATGSQAIQYRIHDLHSKLTTAIQEVLGGPDCWCGSVGSPEGAEPHLKGTGHWCGLAAQREARKEREASL